MSTFRTHPPVALDELKASLSSYAEKVRKHQDAHLNEAQTRITLIGPYLEQLGYDVRDPSIVATEYAADLSHRAGKKVDYAVIHEGRPFIVIEAKAVTTSLGTTASKQLSDYFTGAEAEYAVHTNGIDWHWYQLDVENQRKIATEPFLTHSTLEPKDAEMAWLCRIHAANYDADTLKEHALEMDVTRQIQQWIQATMIEPSEDFGRFLAKQLYHGRTTSKVQQRYQAAAKTALQNLRAEIIDNALARFRETPNNEKDVAQSSVAIDTTPAPVAREVETLTLSDGRKLRSDERPRAWRRDANAEWQVAPTVKDVCKAVLQHLLDHIDTDHADALTAISRSFTYVTGIGGKQIVLHGSMNTPVWNKVLQKALDGIKQSRMYPELHGIEWWLPEGSPKRST